MAETIDPTLFRFRTIAGFFQFSSGAGQHRRPKRHEPSPFTSCSETLQASLELTDADIEQLIAERTQAKKSRNFARADAIRNDLAAKGILLEDSKNGVR